MDNKPIGGYFEWEFPPTKKVPFPDNTIYVNSGKHALEYVLRGINDIKRIWIPCFTCVDVLYPITRLGIPFSFYHINDRFEIIDDSIDLLDGDYIIYTDYFGVNDEYVKTVVNRYGYKVIIDNAHALYSKPIEGVHQIFSPRKFIGMPDGGLVISPLQDTSDSLPQDKSYDRCSQLLKRWELSPSEGYKDYKENGKKNIETPLSRMSELSKMIFMTVDHNRIMNIRRQNYLSLHTALGNSNRLILPNVNTFEVPLVYPYSTDNCQLRQHLISENIFVAQYWPNVVEWTEEHSTERWMADHILPLPIDQRYDEEDMKKIIDIIKKYE